MTPPGQRKRIAIRLLCVQDVYNNCVHEMRLPGSNLLFGIPVVMDTNEESYKPGMFIELTYNGQSIGVMEIESKWQPDKAVEALNCYGTSSLEHPGVLMIATERGKYYMGGKVGCVSTCNIESPVRVAANFHAPSPR